MKEKTERKINFVRIIPVFFSVIGYTTGLFVCFLYFEFINKPIEYANISSVFKKSDPIGSFILLFIIENKYMCLISLSGFFNKSVYPISSSILTYKGILCGFSCLYLSKTDADMPIYLIHSISSSLSLILCAIMCERAINFSVYKTRAKKPSPQNIFAYLLEFLLYSGFEIIVLVSRHLILLLF